jgi:hypothetical protein
MMTIEQFCDRHRACTDGRDWALANCRDMQQAWDTARPDWVVWIATRPGVLDDRTLRKFAVWSARQVQHLMRDPRSTHALDVAERHADGLATDEDLAAARDAAWDAARAAAEATARAAARAAAWAAALDAARAAAEATARAAARDAAWAAAGVAAWDAQAAWLRANATPDWERARKMGGAR